MANSLPNVRALLTIFSTGEDGARWREAFSGLSPSPEANDEAPGGGMGCAESVVEGSALLRTMRESGICNVSQQAASRATANQTTRLGLLQGGGRLLCLRLIAF